MDTLTLPVGEPVDRPDAGRLPQKSALGGRFVALVPVDPEVDVNELYDCSHGDEATESLWTYMGYGPFASPAAMTDWLRAGADSDDPLFFTVHQKSSPRRRVGMVSLMSIVAEMGRLEVGHIWYGPQAQRTKVNTESVYLMLCEAFDRLRYRRVEWKCDSLNERSRAAASRLGFSFEGVFRQHLVVKGRNRDTAWFSMLGGEWPAIKSNMESWLYEAEGRTLSLRQLNVELQRQPADRTNSSHPGGGSHMSNTLVHVGVRATDLEATIRFWRDGLGLPVVSQRGDECYDLSDGHHNFRVFQHNGPQRPAHVSGMLDYLHIGIRVTDLEQTAQRLMDMGYEIFSDGLDGKVPLDVNSLTEGAFKVEDPDGITVDVTASDDQWPGATLK